jgi:hypothetical protein
MVVAHLSVMAAATSLGLQISGSWIVEAHLEYTCAFQLQRIEMRHERLVADVDDVTHEPSSVCTS